jgi:hypothetical protein
LQARDAALAAGAAGFHTFANPHFLLGEQLVGFGLNHGLLRELLFFLNLVGRIVARVWPQFAPVQLNDAGRNAVQKGAVVGDGDDAALEVDQQVFEPSDGIQVEVVGGLVQQEYVGSCDQSLRQCHALAHAARQRLNNRIGVEFQALQGFFQSLLPAPTISRLDQSLQGVQVASAVRVIVDPLHHFSQAFSHGLKNGVLGYQDGFLSHVSDANALLQMQRAIIWPLHARQDFQQ